MNKKRKIAVVILVIIFIAFIIAAYKYIKFTKEYATTDAVFIRTDRITNVSFKRIKGKIVKMNFKEGDFVKKGDLLAQIDPVDYKIHLNEVLKKIDSLKNRKESLEIKKEKIASQLKIKEHNALKTIEMLKEKVKSLDYKIAEINTNIEQLKKDYNRYKNLYFKKAVSKRSYEEIQTKLNSLINSKKSLVYEKKALLKKIDIAKGDLKLIKKEFLTVKELEKSINEVNDNIKALNEKALDIKNSIKYCNLYAPFDAKIGKKYAEVGMNVKSGQPIYSLVDLNDLYVEVLLEENKLEGVKPGCKAFFKVDAYPDEEFEGEVEKIYPASAATYALVPRDISAGEFTKVAQRIIIRVKITKGDKSILIPGMGGEIRIRRNMYSY